MSKDPTTEDLIESFGILSVNRHGVVIHGYDVDHVEEFNPELKRECYSHQRRIEIAEAMIKRWEAYKQQVEIEQGEYHLRSMLNESSHSGD